MIKRFALRTVILSAVLLLLTGADAPSPLFRSVVPVSEPPDAAEWSGRYPFKGPGGENFFDLPWIRNRAVGLLGKTLFQTIAKQWNAAIPILSEGKTLLVQSCNPADCRMNSAVMVDGDGMMLICVDDGVRISWYVSRTTKPLVRASSNDLAVGCLFTSIAEARADLASLRQ